jgi:SNARE protein 1
LLLKNVEVDDHGTSPASEHRYQRLRATLDQVEAFVTEVEQKAAPSLKRPTPILPSIRAPMTKAADLEPIPVEATLIPTEDTTQSVPGANDLIPSSRTEYLPSEPLVPPTLPTASSATSNITATPTILQNSRALQEELSEQLALMATQLRRNATHFSESLLKDKSVVETMQEKLEGNFDFMKKERIRLRDFRGKSGSTTCLVIMSILVVLVAFIFMVLVIRVT